ncbi:hypothetical protein QBC33DRAFT_513408 [Phialemonium atrogriseum]|uniref:Helicase ATP-binding domain-containing protein n=1 Tax=Phialemonium atrogriseum TaxID=1093897 RepID=A0AAJ0C550_9PEZI|nr:uncharacterized protein QBC33DRAFT_513408 [Phialemonium atrogriseum]KAK1769173.1 hypothetical protein QBC33DRAFT_513408 [Phialemonium atrogriseum]
MDLVQDNDPFIWDADRLRKELCTADRTWDAPPNLKFPHPDRLADKLLDLEIDGESLLIYRDMMGSLASLMVDLGINKVPQQLSFCAVVQLLQARSPAYRRWKKNQNGAPDIPDSDVDMDDHLPMPPISETSPALRSAEATAESSATALRSEDPGGIDQATATFPSASEEPPMKKQKRIVPTTISTSPRHSSMPNFIPTEADRFTHADPLSSHLQNSLQDGASDFAYLGAAKLTSQDMFGPDMSSDQDSADQFTWVKSGRLPPGRQLQVNRAMKKYLRLADSTADTPSTPSEKDKVLPLFGESDDEYDSDTYREMEMEEEERIKAAALERKMLSKDEVDGVISDAIQALADLWAETKKPVWDRKALGLWNRHKHAGIRRSEVDKALSRRKRLDARIARICKEMGQDKWRNRDELQRQTASLELSVFDREYECWLMKMLNNPTPPPKPNRLSRPTLPPKKPAATNEGDEEILTSDSDSGFDDFIVDDERMDIEPDLGDASMEDSRMELDPRLESSPGPSSPGPSSPGPSSPGPRTPGPSLLDHQTPASEAVDYDLTQIEDQQPTPDPETPSRHPPGTKNTPIDLAPSPADTTFQAPDRIPGLDDPAALVKVGSAYWERVNDPERLVVTVLHTWDLSERTSLLTCVEESGSDELWQKLIMRATEKGELSPVQDKMTEEDSIDKVAFMLARLFEVYASCSSARSRETARLRRPTIGRIHSHSSLFDKFCQLLRGVEPAPSAPAIPIKIKVKRPRNAAQDNDEPDVGVGDDEEEDIQTASSDSEDDLPLSPANKRRQRKVVRDRAAEDIQEINARQKKEYEERRRLLRERLAVSGSVSADMSQFIINDAKQDDQGFIYVHQHIAGRVKPHQVEGIRFMWNQVVVLRQGCLLAHTMGLGKTMQVITLLVAIAEASRSQDKSISSQVPGNLKKSKTLVLCPAGLVDNWVDELLIWSPQDTAHVSLLGSLSKINASLDAEQRKARVRRWAEDGGVLVIGYTMFVAMCKDDEMRDLLWQKPHIVIADEAHHLKKQQSQAHKATANFRTANRIAMTGTPLANNVGDYYAMINWVAPNYLGSPKDFTKDYEKPIKQGLYSDSSASDKRIALKKLHMLKQTVAPKVHRMGIAALKDDLPTKKEFVIYLRLTDVQMAAYRAYADHVLNDDKVTSQMAGPKIWAFVAILSSLLAHPYVFREKLQKRKDELAVAQGSRAGPSKSGSAAAKGSCLGLFNKSGLAGARSGRAEAATSTDDESNESRVEFPETLLSDVLATVSTRNIEDFDLSWKIMLLTRILDESKRAGDKVLVFSQLLTTLDFIEEVCRRQKRNFSRLDGNTPASERQSSVKRFNTDKGSDVYLITTKAGGVGLNIYGANRVVLFDFKFVPTDEQQAVGRAYRIGQKKPVYVYWLIAGGTFETVVQNRSVFKSQLASRIVDKKNPIAWSKRNGDYFKDPTIPPKAKNLAEYLGKDTVLDALLNSADLEDGIRSIIMTETFEEEDPDDNILTSEDRKEISDFIAMNQRRLREPEQTGRPATGSGLARVPAEWARRPTHGTPPQPAQVPAASPQTPLPLRFPIGARPNEPSSTSSLPAPAKTPLQEGAVVPEVPAQLLRAISPPRIVSQRASNPRPLGAMEPVAGAGTQIRGPVISPPQQPQLPAGPHSNVGQLNITSKKADFLRMLSVAYDALPLYRRKFLAPPHTVVAQVQETLDSQPQPMKGVVLLDHWVSLLKAVQHLNVAKSLIVGVIRPPKLAMMTRIELEQLIAQSTTMSELEFNAMLWNREGPDHLHNNSMRKSTSLGLSTTGDAADDAIDDAIGEAKVKATDMHVIMREIQRSKDCDGTADRPPRLPNWAQRELTKERSKKRDGSATPSIPQTPSRLRPGDSIDSPQVID